MNDKMIAATRIVYSVAASNVDNAKMSDEEFRALIRNTLDVIDYEPPVDHFFTKALETLDD